MVMTQETGPRDVAESSATKITRVELILFSYPMVGVARAASTCPA